MKLETISIQSLSQDPANLRKHSERNLDAIAASLRKFGQQKPLVVDRNNVVLAGNGTLAAAKAIGWTEIEIVRSDLTGVGATAFGIADNRTAELAEWDEKLGEVLSSLKQESFDLADIGFNEDDLARLTQSVAGEEEVAPPDDFQEVDENIETEHECPKCGYKWSGKPS